MEYDTQDFKNDLTKWKVSWAPKDKGAGVLKKTHTKATKTKVVAPTKNATKGKSIAEKLNIKINVKGKNKHNRNDDEDEDDIDTDNDDNEEVDERTYSDSDIDDDDEKDSSMHEKKRKTTRGKSGLAGKGCLIDITNL